MVRVGCCYFIAVLLLIVACDCWLLVSLGGGWFVAGILEFVFIRFGGVSLLVWFCMLFVPFVVFGCWFVVLLV